MYRSRRTTKAYHDHDSTRPKDESVNSCPFCHLDDRPLLNEGPTMMVFANKYPYDFWDTNNSDVIDHLLLVPKRHVESLAELTDEEKIEAINLMAHYEGAGYSVYWRSKNNKSRSVPHQHTHLLKLNNHTARFLFYIKKPYLVWRG